VTETADIVVIGAGMGGVSAAFELAKKNRVILLEREDQPSYHSSGRSAATLIETFDNPVIRGMTLAARLFLERGVDLFGPASILSVRGLLIIAREDQVEALDTEIACAKGPVEKVDGRRALAIHPGLNDAYVSAAIYDGSAADIDVHAMMQGYLKGLRFRGGRLMTNAEVTAIERHADLWRIETQAGAVEAPVLVNAAGAWADLIAKIAGVRPIGLVPKRRTVINVDPPTDVDVSNWPMVVDVGEQFYFKPDAGRILASPADQTPSPPTDAQAEEIDVAHAVDRLERATTMTVRRVTHRWAGLRSFVDDNTPVVGPAPDAEGFFWLAAQGGYGIMIAPALAWILAAAVVGQDLPTQLTDLGIDAADVAPARLHGRK